MELYHGGNEIIEFPEIRKTKYTKDFSWGFYCTIADCRSGKIHNYDIVEGPMADDTVWNFLNDFIAGTISRSAFWELAKFKHPSHQISFHTLQALETLTFLRSEKLHD